MNSVMMVIMYHMMDAIIVCILVVKTVKIVTKVYVKVVKLGLYLLFQNVFLIVQISFKIKISVILKNVKENV